MTGRIITLVCLTLPHLLAQSTEYSPNQYHIQTDHGGDRFFKYQTWGGQYRKETRLQDGTMLGTYGWVDATGTLRLYDYIADKKGYRVTKKRLFKVKPVDKSHKLRGVGALAVTSSRSTVVPTLAGPLELPFFAEPLNKKSGKPKNSFSSKPRKIFNNAKSAISHKPTKTSIQPRRISLSRRLEKEENEISNEIDDEKNEISNEINDGKVGIKIPPVLFSPQLRDEVDDEEALLRKRKRSRPPLLFPERVALLPDEFPGFKNKEKRRLKRKRNKARQVDPALSRRLEVVPDEMVAGGEVIPFQEPLLIKNQYPSGLKNPTAAVSNFRRLITPDGPRRVPKSGNFGHRSSPSPVNKVKIEIQPQSALPSTVLLKSVRARPAQGRSLSISNNEVSSDDISNNEVAGDEIGRNFARGRRKRVRVRVRAKSEFGRKVLDYNIGQSFHTEAMNKAGERVGQFGWIDPLGVQRVTDYQTLSDGALVEAQSSQFVGTNTYFKAI